MIKILNTIPSGDQCGWGVCGYNLSKSLPKFCELVTDADDADVILAPVVNHRWSHEPVTVSKINGKKQKPLVGYAFHEFKYMGTEQIQYLPQHWTALACGSSWMERWVRSALQGVADDFPTATVLQGVDKDLFYYRKKDGFDIFKDRFVVGSAGKFEYRKAQDVVIETFRRFKKQVPEAMLCAAWDNPWEASMQTMKNSPYKWGLEMVNDNGATFIGGVDRALISANDQVMWRMGPHADMPNFYRNIDVMLFPNRCEAGTNLPMMEAIASGVPCIIMDGHGHEDIVDLVDTTCCTFLEGGKVEKWPKDTPMAEFIEPCLSEINSDLHLMHRQNTSEEDRIMLSNSLNSLTWDNTAEGLVDLCEKVVK